MRSSPLERLISLGENGSSEERRALLREVTNTFLVAPDRYGRREMELFDLLLTRTASAMDMRLRKIIVVALVKAGAPESAVERALDSIPSPNERFLRRSVMQTTVDLVTFLREHNESGIEEPFPSLSDGGPLDLPSAMPPLIYQYQMSAYCHGLASKIGLERAEALMRVSAKFRDDVIAASIDAGREEVLTAKRTVLNWHRARELDENVLVELLEARAMTEFLFAAMTLFGVDAPTMLRALNDQSFESLAILHKSKGIRRATFAKVVFGFRHRRADTNKVEQILPVYDRLSQAVAQRTLRFFNLRISEIVSEEGRRQTTLSA